MFQINGYVLLRNMQFLNKLVGQLQGSGFSQSNRGQSIIGEFEKFNRDMLQLIDVIKSLDIPLSLVSAQKLSKLIFENDRLTVEDFISCVDELSNRLSDELGNKLLIVMSNHSLRYLQTDHQPFDKSIIEKFPDIENELIEAATCLAYEIPTAAVFHLMRAMEIAIRNLATRLRITNIEVTWGELIASIKTEIEKMPKGTERDRWSENLSLLYHVKQAWRNTTMHPNLSYTLAESVAIYDAVCSYLINLALLMDNGA